MARVLVGYLAFVALVLAAIVGFGLRAESGNIHARAVNVDAFGGLLAAVTAAGTDNTALLVDRVHTIPAGTGCTLLETTEVIFTPGSGISVASGATLNYQSAPVAGPYRIFYGSGESTFTAGALEAPFNGLWVGGASGFGLGTLPSGVYFVEIAGDIGAEGGVSVAGGVTAAGRIDSKTGVSAPEIRGQDLYVDTLHGVAVSTADLPDPITVPVQTTELIYGGVSKFYVYTGTTLSAAMLAGGMVLVHTPLSGSTPTVIGIPAVSGSTAFFAVWDMTGGGVTVQMTDGGTLYDDDETGTAYWVSEGHSRHAASFTLNAESGACSYGIVIGTTGAYWEMF